MDSVHAGQGPAQGLADVCSPSSPASHREGSARWARPYDIKSRGRREHASDQCLPVGHVSTKYGVIGRVGIEGDDDVITPRAEISLQSARVPGAEQQGILGPRRMRRESRKQRGRPGCLWCLGVLNPRSDLRAHFLERS